MMKEEIERRGTEASSSRPPERCWALIVSPASCVCPLLSGTPAIRAHTMSPLKSSSHQFFFVRVAYSARTVFAWEWVRVPFAAPADLLGHSPRNRRNGPGQKKKKKEKEKKSFFA
ncbi:hypothetical protein QOT17_009079 [Balamuthia mandrillaris]